MRIGDARRLTGTFKRNGTVSLIAALAVHKGEITAQTMARNDADNFLLKRIYKKDPGKHLHIIVDSLQVHKHQKAQEWVEGKSE